MNPLKDTIFINGWTKGTVLDHIRKNFKGRSVVQGRGQYNKLCLYRSTEGKKCAVGLFIPDGEIADSVAKNANEAAVDVLLGLYSSLTDLMPLRLSGLCELQSMHDMAQSDADALRRMVDYIEGLT